MRPENTHSQRNAIKFPQQPRRYVFGNYGFLWPASFRDLAYLWQRAGLTGLGAARLKRKRLR
jgi:hypothetical protein